MVMSDAKMPMSPRDTAGSLGGRHPEVGSYKVNKADITEAGIPSSLWLLKLQIENCYRASEWVGTLRLPEPATLLGQRDHIVPALCHP